uniref:Uncharacterized protein n=1 Tax=Panagrellus redivivus TaxID=6233 RepID=A0A7E4VLE2_PANRE
MQEVPKCMYIAAHFHECFRPHLQRLSSAVKKARNHETPLLNVFGLFGCSQSNARSSDKVSPIRGKLPLRTDTMQCYCLCLQLARPM